MNTNFKKIVVNCLALLKIILIDSNQNKSHGKKNSVFWILNPT
jgi:hypothetical protein